MTADLPTGVSVPTRAPIAMLGVPFDAVTCDDALAWIDQVVASGRPHYFVTANVDFLVQACADVELRRIFLDSDLVVCDGTPPLWASRLLGNRLPERVAGADLVPLLLSRAEERGYRVFFLGSSEEVAARAVAKLKTKHPRLNIAGQYSPPYSKLLEMDHEESRRRILAAKPDLLFVCFGCPKQEKWIWMHYRQLGVPVAAGVGATVDFLAGQFKRAPLWMRDAGCEWLFRLAQEPRRLLRRYCKDLLAFGTGMLRQQWRLGRWRTPFRRRKIEWTARSDEQFEVVTIGGDLDAAAWENARALIASRRDKHLVLELSKVRSVDSTGMGILMRLHKRWRNADKQFVLAAPSRCIADALGFMRLANFFTVASDVETARQCVTAIAEEEKASVSVRNHSVNSIQWRGEVTAANAQQVWQATERALCTEPVQDWTLDLGGLRFIDSTGLGLMIKARKVAAANHVQVRFRNLTPQVMNVIRLARLQDFLLREESSAEKHRQELATHKI